MSHLAEGFAKAKTTKELLEFAKTVQTKEEAQLFVKEGAAFARGKATRYGRLPISPASSEEVFKEIVCRAAAKEGPELLAHFEELFDYTLRPPAQRVTIGDLLDALMGQGMGQGRPGPCPGCPNCQPERFDPNIITVEGHTVSEEPRSAGLPRQLPSKSR